MTLLGSGPVLLDTPEKMLAIWKELSEPSQATEWRATMDNWNTDGTMFYRIQFNNNNGDKATAYIGDQVVLTYGKLITLKAGEF